MTLEHSSAVVVVDVTAVKVAASNADTIRQQHHYTMYLIQLVRVRTCFHLYDMLRITSYRVMFVIPAVISLRFVSSKSGIIQVLITCMGDICTILSCRYC